MITRALCIFVLMFSAHSAHGQIAGLPELDFKRFFPYMVAVSEIQKDVTFPDGFQYKFITVKDEEDKAIFLALVRREGSSRLVRLYVAKGPLENAEASMRGRVQSFGDKLKLKFEVIDLKDVRTSEEFKTKAENLGWETGLPAK
jgi:hypothetical protein